VRITIASIQRAVADRHHVSVKAIRGPSRRPQTVRARHAAVYLARRLTPHSYAVISRWFGGRDHSTLIHSCKRVQERIHRNQKSRVFIARMIDELTQ
jgi:chromosomal replication initiator protein